MTEQSEKPPSMKVVGYTDRLSVQAGQRIRFMVSCEEPRYRADIVRLIHGDPNPKGPGFKEEEIETSVSKDYRGRVQKIYKGSFVAVRDSKKKLDAVRSITLLAWIYPTTPLKGLQGILTKWATDDGAGYGLFINERGEASLRLAARDSKVEELSSGVALRPRTWYFVAATYDSATGRTSLRQEPVAGWPIDDTRITKEAFLSKGAIGPSGARFLIAAHHDSSSGKNRAGGFYNGKIESPMLFGVALTPKALERLGTGRLDAVSRRRLIAEWDFTVGFSSATATDVSPHKLHGTIVNTPTRAVPGHSWTGRKTNFNESPSEFGAIHFHEDDLEDARWDVDFEFRIPDTMKSGVYAARLRTEGGEDYLPFFVRRKRGKAPRVALLLPTYSYLAYADIHTMLEGAQDVLFTLPGLRYPSQPQETYMVENRITGLYDSHTDGSGVAYTSRLKPIVNMRPKYTETVAYNGRGSPHQFNADLHLVDWLEAKGIQFDVITDEDLNQEGTKALADYRVVVSGSHPEYWTERMLDSLQSYLGDGGRFMYMGGNGLYWVTSVDPARPHVIELRRWGGTGTWLADAGEYYHSTTGELGGLWRNRGRSPQRLVGTGMTSSIEGIKEENRPYRREKGSFDPRVAFIFEGIGRDELIGDFPNLVGGSGAAGFEIDRLDYSLGTPPHTLLLATASGYEGDYQGAMEDATVANLKVPNAKDPNIRADMVYLEYPKGGAVFSTGSIAWCGCLSYDRYQNNVSRITENVLREFSKP
jgi:N,N-dimethylformamidase